MYFILFPPSVVGSERSDLNDRFPERTQARTRTPSIWFSISPLGRRRSCRLHYWPDLNCPCARRWNPGGNTSCLVQISCFNHEEAAELLARLGKWTVGHHLFAIAHSDTACGL